MKKLLTLLVFISLGILNSYTQDSLGVMISSKILSGGEEGYLHLKISDTINNAVIYDSLAFVSVLSGFKDSLFLDSGVYKCEILQQDADVDLPKLTLSNGEYPVLVDNYFLFGFPINNSLIQSKDSIEIIISTEIFNGDSDEWIHFKISDTITGEIWCQRNVAVTVLNGFSDSIYLDTGVYKFEILGMGANVSMPIIELDNGTIAVWGSPDYEYFLFSLPGVVSSVYSNTSDVHVNVFPNPFVDNVSITSEHTIKSYRIFDLTGKTIAVRNDLNNNHVTINIDGFSNGVYFIQYQIGNKIYTGKVLKEKH